VIDVQYFPVNTHGGLLGMGAPWEVCFVVFIVLKLSKQQQTTNKQQRFLQCTMLSKQSCNSQIESVTIDRFPTVNVQLYMVMGVYLAHQH
jgi:hypothetical protein